MSEFSWLYDFDARMLPTVIGTPNACICHFGVGWSLIVAVPVHVAKFESTGMKMLPAKAAFVMVILVHTVFVILCRLAGLSKLGL